MRRSMSLLRCMHASNETTSSVPMESIEAPERVNLDALLTAHHKEGGGAGGKNGGGSGGCSGGARTRGAASCSEQTTKTTKTTTRSSSKRKSARGEDAGAKNGGAMTSTAADAEANGEVTIIIGRNADCDIVLRGVPLASSLSRVTRGMSASEAAIRSIQVRHFEEACKAHAATPSCARCRVDPRGRCAREEGERRRR